MLKVPTCSFIVCLSRKLCSYYYTCHTARISLRRSRVVLSIRELKPHSHWSLVIYVLKYQYITSSCALGISILIALTAVYVVGHKSLLLGPSYAISSHSSFFYELTTVWYLYREKCISVIYLQERQIAWKLSHFDVIQDKKSCQNCNARWTVFLEGNLKNRNKAGILCAWSHTFMYVCM
jgi:hypothetical protein